MERKDLALEMRKYLIGKRYLYEKMLGAHTMSARRVANSSKENHKMNEPRYEYCAMKTRERLAKEYNVVHMTIWKYSIFAEALDTIYDISEELASAIMRGKIKLSQENVVAISKLSDKEIQNMAEHLLQEQTDFKNFSGSRKLLSKANAEKTTDNISAKAPSIKDMPQYDPDSEVASLALTIPSWISSEMFYSYCKLGYEANQYKGIDKLTAKELYLMHADGRDEGLRDIDGNSPTAFSEWYESSRKGIGHPWEVCRGGNSTHISLYVRKNGNEYSVKLAGSSYGRSVETIKFFLALVRNNIPVSLYEAEELAARVRADDKIGIVPDGVMPFYCSSYFPDDENISDYMNIELYEDKERWKKVIENVIWQEIEKQRLL